jgi:uncharacterized membrane protein YphA (DoxX/SURF4 family)
MTGLLEVFLPYTSYLALALRVGVGLCFVNFGYPRLGAGRKHAIQWTGRLGIPAFMSYSAILLEFFGGLCLIIGFVVPIVAFLLALEMIGIIYLKRKEGRGQYCMVDIAYFMLAVALVVLGGGSFSVDSYLGL